MNYFELFDLPVQLQVDGNVLNSRYVALQKQFHPDFHTQAAEEEQQAALERSSEVNKALKVLQQPDATMKYVLQLKGVLEDDEKYQLPPDFLMEMMELNEELSEGGDETGVRSKMEQLEKELYAEVQPLVEGYDDEQVTPAALEAIKGYYYKKKYLRRILERLDD